MELIFELVLLSLFMQAFKQEECYCGFTDEASSEIINGHDVEDSYKYPWMVGVKPSGSYCGGALISPTFILTAAHCNDEKEIEGVKIHFVGESGKPQKSFDVKNVINHPKYDNESGLKAQYDISLWQLDGSVECKQNTIPICLPEEELSEEGLEVTIMGFGKTEDDEENIGGDGDQGVENVPETSGEAEDATWELKEGTAQIVDFKLCADEGKHKDMPEAPLHCVQGTNNSTTCQGDSGSSMFIEKDGVIYTIGLVSGSRKGGCDTDSLKYFVDTFHYRDFIKQNVKDLPKPKTGQQSTVAPSESPTTAPTESPTTAPTESPTTAPTESPTTAPTTAPAAKSSFSALLKQLMGLFSGGTEMENMDETELEEINRLLNEDNSEEPDNSDSPSPE